MNRWLSGIFVLLLFVPAAFTAEPDLTGKWKLNEEESDDPREKFFEQMEREGRPVGKGMRSRAGKEGEERGRGRNMMATMTEMTISYSAPELKITDSTGVERIYYTDGRKSQMEVTGGRKIFLTTKWEDDQLVVESEGPEGGKMTQSIYLSPGGDQLNVKTRMQPLMLNRPITIVRVYDRME